MKTMKNLLLVVLFAGISCSQVSKPDPFTEAVNGCLLGAEKRSPSDCFAGLVSAGPWTVEDVAYTVATIERRASARLLAKQGSTEDAAVATVAHDWLASKRITVKNGQESTKKIKLKVGQLVNMVPALEHVAALKLPPKTSYWLARRLKVLGPEVAVFEKKRDELIREYGTPDDKGQTAVKQDSKKWPEFAAKVNALVEAETEVEINKIQVEELQATDSAVTPSDLLLLDPILEAPAQ
jgi:hypothetical protein